MPRQPRYLVPDIPQHVIQRGVNRQAVFFDEGDYQLYLATLFDAAEQFGCQIHAFALMTNHTHLLVTPMAERAIPQVIQAIGRSYVQAINKKHDRTGTLWEGRYRASPVQDDLYFLTCQRYIELNPVRAGMVSDPAEYRFSSYCHNALRNCEPCLSPHPVYLALGSTPGTRRAAYRRLFRDHFDDENLGMIRKATNACLVIGDDAFQDRMENVLGRPVRPGHRGRPRKTRFDPN